MIQYLARTPALNSSEHGHCANYCDATLGARVAEWDAAMIVRHDYALEATGS